jgi:hypothetical protein
MKVLFCVFVCVLLGACVVRPVTPRDRSWSVLTEEETKALAEPVTCSTKPECDAAWRKATAWVIALSPWKVQIATEYLLQTYGPQGKAGLMAFTLSRDPVHVNGETIVLTPSCIDYGMQCQPFATEAKARAQFALHMRRTN